MCDSKKGEKMNVEFEKREKEAKSSGRDTASHEAIISSLGPLDPSDQTPQPYTKGPKRFLGDPCSAMAEKV